MSRNHETTGTPKRRNILSGVISMLLGMPLATLAGPEGEHVIHGDVDITRPGPASTIVRQHTQNALLDWQSFDIDADELVAFQQPGSESIAVNRVIGGSPTEILGQLQANGQVFILNTQGVYFAPTAQLDVHGLVAAAGTISSSDFLTGKYRISNITGNVTNAGNIQANSGGYIMLAGERIENTGTLSVSNGDIGLAAGRQVTVNVAGDELIGFTVDEAALGSAAGIHNAGDIIGDGGIVVMEARTAGDLASAAINQEGRVRANSTSIENGRIMLRASGGDIRVSGELDADGTNGKDGGGIAAISDHDTIVESGAKLHADGINGGDGGMVRVIASGNLDVHAGSRLSTVGATGGIIEVSGHENFNFQGESSAGTGGTFLIDPADVSIVAGSGVTANTIGVDDIVTQLGNGTGVMIIASNSITIQESITNSSGGPGGSLVLGIGTINSGCATPGDPFCYGGLPSTTLLGDGTITLEAGKHIDILGNIFMQAREGDIRLGGQLTSQQGNVLLDAGSLTSTSTPNDGRVRFFGAGVSQEDVSINAGGGYAIVDAGREISLGEVHAASLMTLRSNGGTQDNYGNISIADSTGGTPALSADQQIQIIAAGGNSGANVNIAGGIESAFHKISIETTGGDNGGNVNVYGPISAGTGAGNDVIIDASSTGNGASIRIEDSSGAAQDIYAAANIHLDSNTASTGGTIIAGNIVAGNWMGTVEIGGNQAVGDITVGNVSSGNGVILLRSTGDIAAGDITGNVIVTVETNSSSDGSGNLTAGNIDAGSNITLSATGAGSGGNLHTGMLSNDVNNISLDATGNVTTGALTANGGYIRLGSSTTHIGGAISTGDISSANHTSLYADGNVATGSVDVGGLSMASNGSAVFAGPVSVGVIADPFVTQLPDENLDDLLTNAGMPGTPGAPSSSFSAESLTFGDTVTLDGDYIYFSSDSLSFNGDVTLGNPDAVVQVTPYTDGASFGLEAVADNAAGLASKTGSNADAGYTWEGMLEYFADATLVLGHSMASGDAFLGLDGAIDIAGSNLLLLTSGTLTGIGNIISTGIVAAPLSTLAPALPDLPVEPESPVGSVFEIPLLDEIDNESDEDENRLAGSSDTSDGNNESDGTGVTHRTAPESLECSI